MKTKLFLNSLVIEEARTTAIGEGFREVTRILRAGGRDFVEVSSQEAELLWTFTSYLKMRARLLYPGWCDTEPGYNPDDEYAFQEVNQGLFEALRSELNRAFPNLDGDSKLRT